MSLDFALATDHRTVAGVERITFRPDRPITQLVFRPTANSAPSVAAGTRIVIRSATADHGAGRFLFAAAGAGHRTQGGLLRIPFGATLAAGSTVSARITFTLTLGARAFDQFGRDGSFAFFGSGNPPDPPRRGTADRVWRSHAPTARDVSVAAGPFAVADGLTHGVRVRVGASTPATARVLEKTYAQAIAQLSARFGPYPFASLSVARLSSTGGGIEYPSSILAFDSSRSVATHETAHHWFYALVGNSQATHPWLDEAFATYAEGLIDHDVTSDETAELAATSLRTAGAIP